MAVPANLEQFLAAALPRFKADKRFLGVAAGGSYIKQELDEYSDLDLVIVVRDPSFEEVMGERKAIAESLGTLLQAFTGEHVGEPRLVICLYDEPLAHVDLKFVAFRDFADRVEDPVVLWERSEILTKAIKENPSRWPPTDLQWIEDRFWVWVHYIAGKIGRGELFEALDALGMVRSVVLGPMAAIADGQHARGARKLESISAKYAALMKKSVATHDRRACAEALGASIELYRELRKKVPAAKKLQRSKAEGAAVKYFEAVAKAKK